MSKVEIYICVESDNTRMTTPDLKYPEKGELFECEFRSGPLDWDGVDLSYYHLKRISDGQEFQMKCDRFDKLFRLLSTYRNEKIEELLR